MNYSSYKRTEEIVDKYIKKGANIKNDSGLLIMDMPTLVNIIEEYHHEQRR